MSTRVRIHSSLQILTCGVDEVGRGALAGPVLSTAVIFPQAYHIPQVRDSKKIQAKKRESLAKTIQQQALAVGHGWVGHKKIDELNIHYASLQAMILAIDGALHNLSYTFPLEQRTTAYTLEFLIDGKFIPNIKQSKYYGIIRNCEMKAIIKGDDKNFHISAASILAKVTRDSWMILHDKEEPMYGFAKHKGYPTPEHKSAIVEYGASNIQRLSFRTSSID